MTAELLLLDLSAAGVCGRKDEIDQLQRCVQRVVDSGSVETVSIERPRSSLIQFDQESKDWVNTRDEDQDIETVIGNVTSGTQSPSLNKAIGMGYVSKPFSKADTEIFILIRDKAIKAKVVKAPFYKG